MRRLVLTLIAFLALAPSAHAAWVWPVTGDVITPYRNGTDPYASGQHRGIDIAAASGAPVVAAAAGEVRFAGTAGSSGLTVSIRTGDGYDTSYLHLSALAVRAGARVGAGDRIGAIGTSGTRSATQPHLHFGVRDAGSRHAYHDPLGFLPPLATPRAPDAPSPATAPEPVTAPPAGAPAPLRATAPRAAPRVAPVRRPARRPAPAGRRAPRPVPVRQPSSRPAPASALRAHPISVRGAAPGPAADERRLPQAAPRGRAIDAPAAANARGADARSGLVAPDPPASPRDARADANAAQIATKPSDHASRGAHIGWALACAGLLLAAGVLGLSEGGRRAGRGGGGRLPGALRPLLGRR
jgi:hypothetical protein